MRELDSYLLRSSQTSCVFWNLGEMGVELKVYIPSMLT